MRVLDLEVSVGFANNAAAANIERLFSSHHENERHRALIVCPLFSPTTHSRLGGDGLGFLRFSEVSHLLEEPTTGFESS